MSNQAINPQNLARRESEIELLARETDMPVENVHAIYNIEYAKLERVVPRISNQAINRCNPQDLARRESEIELLARGPDMERPHRARACFRSC